MSGGPFADVSFAGLTARSISSDVRADGYSARTTINNGFATGLLTFDRGPVAVPVPEPSAEVAMILALAGASWRKRCTSDKDARADAGKFFNPI